MKCCLKTENGCLKTQTKHPLRFLNCFCSEIDWDNTIWGERALSWVREVFFLGCTSAWGNGLWFWLKMVEPKPGGNSGLGFFV